MNYAALFTLTPQHAYYTSGRSADFRLEPAPETLQVLERYGLRWIAEPSRWRVLTPVDEQGLPVKPLPVKTCLRFWLRLATPGVLRFSQFHPMLKVDDVLRGEAFQHYTNDTGEELTSAVHHHRQTDPLRIVRPALAEAFRLLGQPVSGLSMGDFTIDGLGSGAQVVDYDPAERSVYISTEGHDPDQTFQLSYRAIPAWSPGVFGIIDITVRTPATTDQRYRFPVANRQSHWVYYLVSDTDYQISELDIEDRPIQALPDGSTATITFTVEDVATPPSGDPTAAWLARKFSGAARRIRFTSSLISYEEELRKVLDLTYHGQVIRSWLPVPSRDISETQIIHDFS